MSPPIYLDHHATTPCDPAVVEAMRPYWTEHFGNASSSHPYGTRAAAAVDLAREQVATLIGATPADVLFTSGATESNNLAILGVADAVGEPAHLITAATEHKAVLDPCRALERRGWSVTRLRPDPEGFINPASLREALRPDTALVSLMAANNEIGTLANLPALGAVCREAGVPFHTDAAQAAGRLPLDVGALPVDLLSLSAHKMYGPKGVGALWIRRRGRPRVRLKARQVGGGQERGLRAGTLPVPLLVGMGRAAALALADLESGEPQRQAGLRDALWEALRVIPGVERHGPSDPDRRLGCNLLVTFSEVRAPDLLLELRREVAASQGSACSTGDPEPSHVLTALGVPPDRAIGALRLGLGRSTTPPDVDRAARAIAGAVARARRITPPS